MRQITTSTYFQYHFRAFILEFIAISQACLTNRHHQTESKDETIVRGKQAILFRIA